MVLLEALSTGLCIVTTSLTAEHDVIKQGENGFICHPDDQDRFLLALERLVVDKELRKAISEKNRQLARNNYEIQSVAGRYQEIFKENSRGQ
jgi:glycosyltransferase involved in cell wall biosynthesis